MEQKLTVGVKQTMRLLEQNLASEVLIAQDADYFVIRPGLEEAKRRQVEIRFVDSRAALGRICGISIGAAVACRKKQI